MRGPAHLYPRASQGAWPRSCSGGPLRRFSGPLGPGPCRISHTNCREIYILGGPRGGRDRHVLRVQRGVRYQPGPRLRSQGLRVACRLGRRYVNPLALTDLPMCPSFGRCATVGKASPECQVGRSSRNFAQCVLCELRPQGLLRSSVFSEVHLRSSPWQMRLLARAC